jgi:hypothetical protein
MSNVVRNLNSFAATLLCDATVAVAVENRQKYYGKNQSASPAKRAYRKCLKTLMHQLVLELSTMFDNVNVSTRNARIADATDR